MFNQIFDKFDTALDFEAYQTNSNRLNPLGTDWVVSQSKQLWDLWVKENVTFRFSDYSSSTINHTLTSVAFLYNNQDKLLNPATDWVALNKEDGTKFWSYNDNVNDVKNIWDVVPDRPLKTLAVYNHWFDQFVHYRDHCNALVEVPFTMLTRQIGDISEKTDVVAATGLETLEITRDFDELTAKSIPVLGVNLNDDESNRQHRTQFQAVLASLCTEIARRRILKGWPGWQEMFQSKDYSMLSSKTTVQSYVTGKNHQASEYERFCTALAYNINSTNNRVKLPPGAQYKAATDIVRAGWPAILQAANINERLTQLSDLLVEVRKVLSQDRDKSKKEKSPPSTTYSPSLNPESGDYKDKHRNHIVEATPTEADAKPKDDDLYKFVNARVQTVQECLAYNERSTRYEACVEPFHRGVAVRVDEALREQAATAAWFVPSPPPSEHGQTTGYLDEGSLHRFVGWGDHHIFDLPPDIGAGQVAIAVLVDCSGSMNGKPVGQAKTFLDAILFGCKRKPNVTITGFGFCSSDKHCDMLQVDRLEDVKHMYCAGGTPTAVAIQNAGRWLESTYPNAARGVVVLTDGEPIGRVFDAKHSGPNDVGCYNNDETVARAVSELPFPVIGVGFSCATKESMASQYGARNSYMVSQPEDAVKIICDVLQSATV